MEQRDPQYNELHDAMWKAALVGGLTLFKFLKNLLFACFSVFWRDALLSCETCTRLATIVKKERRKASTSA